MQRKHWYQVLNTCMPVQVCPPPLYSLSKCFLFRCTNREPSRVYDHIRISGLKWVQCVWGVVWEIVLQRTFLKPHTNTHKPSLLHADNRISVAFQTSQTFLYWRAWDNGGYKTHIHTLIRTILHDVTRRYFKNTRRQYPTIYSASHAYLVLWDVLQVSKI